MIKFYDKQWLYDITRLFSIMLVVFRKIGGSTVLLSWNFLLPLIYSL